jgi:hypothetical protein
MDVADSVCGLRYGASGRNAARQPYIAADDGSGTNGDAPENARARMNDNVVFYNGMAW